MCLIVAKEKAEASFSVQDFRASQGRNSDGTGIMYVENGRVIVEKIMGNLKDQLEVYYKHMNKPKFILHHRFATQGEKSELNVHPFKVLSIDDGDPYDLYFAHNGNIPMGKFNIVTAEEKKMSDTHLFAVQYLQPLMRRYPDIIEEPVFQMMLHDFIGLGNKLAFLRNDGRVFIFNKGQGGEHNGCWLSNTYSVQSNTNTRTYGKNHGANGYGWGHEAFDENDYYEEQGVWRNDWRGANQNKAKGEESLSGLDINELLKSIEIHAGIPEETLKELVIADRNLTYDMINLLTIGKKADETVLSDEASKVAAQLNDLFQGYLKKRAA